MIRKPFVNPHVSDLRRSVWDFILWKVGRYKEEGGRSKPPENFIYPGIPPKFVQGAPTAIWIGHSTYLIEIDGIFILTDPVWDDYCSPIPMQMFKRKQRPPFQLQDLPPIDLVLLSHNHYDHLDAKTVRFLKKYHPQIQWIVPEGVSKWFLRRNIERVKELSWWESVSFCGGKITAVPAQHFSGRSLWDKNRTHWNGFVFEKGGKKLYFSGDTGYNPHDFKKIGKHFQGMDLSLIPIGTYAPKKFMEPVHISPYEAVAIHQDVNSQLSLGMHWNTFCLSEEPFDRPPYDLYLAMSEKQIPFDSFLPIEIGSYVNF